jgi:signal transduction histidine kinase
MAPNPTIIKFEEPGPLKLRVWILIWNILSFTMAAVITIMALVNTEVDWPRRFIASQDYTLGWRLAAMAGSALWAGWYWIFVVRYDQWIGKAFRKALSFFFAIALAFGLSWVYPGYLYLLFGLFGVAFGVLPLRWSIPVVVVLPLAIIARVLAGRAFDQNALGFVSGMVMYSFIAIMMGTYIASIIRSNFERQKVIEALSAAQKELALRERQAGVLGERQRIAAAIHDTLAQNLTSIVMHLEAAEQALPGAGSDQNSEPSRQYLTQARQAAREGLAEARRFVWALQPEVGEGEPLDQAVRRVVERWQAETGISAALSLEGAARRLPPPVEVALLRSAQEGLANVRRHANASQVNLTLTYMEDEVVLDVQDNGQGFEPQRAFQPRPDGGGYGLFSLRERARELGGSLTVESEAGQGATLVLQLPVGRAMGEEGTRWANPFGC